MSLPVAHVLLDADGVLQHVPTDWRELVGALLGEDAEAVVREVVEAEKAPMRGDGDFLLAMEGVLLRHGSPATAEQLHAAVWARIEELPASIEVVHGLRAAGYGVHLGTNQHAQRAALMRAGLGYDALFDVSVYSCEIGVAKPDPVYFERAVALVGAEPASVLFVDDREDNVLGARAAGLRAEQWHYLEGLDVLEKRLGEHGVELGGLGSTDAGAPAHT